MMRVLAGVILAVVLSSCKGDGATSEPASTEETAGKKAGAEADAPPSIAVTADRKDLIFSYASPGKDFQTATSITEVPDDAKKSVIVTDLSLTPEQRQSGRYVYIADLTKAHADGTYPVAIASRYGFESKLTQTSTASGAGGGGVVVYTTSWCGVCKRAKSLLKQLGVAFVEKDIEASKSAAEELAMKARGAGIQPGGVPVIDVGGVMLQGLDEPTLRSALKEKGFLR